MEELKGGERHDIFVTRSSMPPYPDYNYCDTEWKAIDMYSIDGFENIVAGEGFRWKGN